MSSTAAAGSPPSSSYAAVLRASSAPPTPTTAAVVAPRSSSAPPSPTGIRTSTTTTAPPPFSPPSSVAVAAFSAGPLTYAAVVRKDVAPASFSSSPTPAAVAKAAVRASPSAPPSPAAVANAAVRASPSAPPIPAAVAKAAVRASPSAPPIPAAVAKAAVSASSSAAAAKTVRGSSSSAPTPTAKTVITKTLKASSSSPTHPAAVKIVTVSSSAPSPSTVQNSSTIAMPSSSGAGPSRVMSSVPISEIVTEPDDEILVCSSNDSFRRTTCLRRNNNQRTRLIENLRSKGKSRLSREGDAGATPSIEEDLPDDFNRATYNALMVVQLVSFGLFLSILGFVLAIPMLRKREVFELHLWKWVLVGLALTSGRLLSGWVIKIILHMFNKILILRKRVSYFVDGMKSSLQNCLWFGLIAIVWIIVFDRKTKHVRDTKFFSLLSKMWVCFLVGMGIWVLKTLGVMILASSFHVNTFFDRIQKTLFNQYVMETLSPIRVRHQESDHIVIDIDDSDEGASGGRIICTSTDSDSKNGMITVGLLQRLDKKNVSSWNMKKLIKIVRKGVLSTRDEYDQTMVPIMSEDEAKEAGKKLFLDVAKPGSTHIYLEDLKRFMPEDLALKTLHLFEEDGTERINKRAVKKWAVIAYKERKALALTLDDTKTAVKELQQILNVVVGTLIVVVSLLLLKVATSKFFIFIGSQILLAGFMFANTCKTTFESIVFMFMMHPYDVGDRVEIDGVQMIVDEMSILTTTFLKSDQLKIYYPNSVLFAKPICNFYRSPDMDETLDFCLHISTPVEKIDLMKEKIKRYVDNRSDHWRPAPVIVIRDVEDMNKLRFTIFLTHKMNHQDMIERWSRRSRLLEEMVKIFRELDVEHRLLPIDVNLRNISSTRVPSNWITCASRG